MADLRRAELLFHQSRYDMAAAEIRAVLSLDPQDAAAHSLLALCLVHQHKFNDAQSEAQEGIALAPDMAYAHYAYAAVFYERRMMQQARAAAEQAIAIDPDNADFHALLSQVFVSQRHWSDALAVAERGLQVDPEHVSCTNLRAIALVHLNQRGQAHQTIDAALQRDPENAITHANQGLALLHSGEHLRAMEHFREALRIDPTNQWARAGIVEALKARHIVYRLMLKYFLWMSRLSPRARWGLVVGGFFGAQILFRAADDNPSLKVAIYPLIITYAVFALMSWVAPFLFNLLLCLNRFGRAALNDRQKVDAIIMGVWLLITIAAAVPYLFTHDTAFLFLAMRTGILITVLAGALSCDPGWPRWVMLGILAILFLLPLGEFLFWFGHPTRPEAQVRILDSVMLAFLWGVVGSQFLSGYLATRHVRR